MYLINLSDRIAKVMMVFAAVWAFGLSFLIVADALSRSFLNFPLNGTKDIVENSIVIIDSRGSIMNVIEFGFQVEAQNLKVWLFRFKGLNSIKCKTLGVSKNKIS